MNKSSAFEVEVQRLLKERIAQIQRLSSAEVSVLPEAAGTEVFVCGHRCQLTVFVQSVTAGTLVVVQLARRAMAGLVTFHQERGVVFAPDGSVRHAAEHELLVTGG